MTLQLFSNGTQKNVKSLTLDQVYELCVQQAPELICIQCRLTYLVSCLIKLSYAYFTSDAHASKDKESQYRGSYSYCSAVCSEIVHTHVCKGRI